MGVVRRLVSARHRVRVLADPTLRQGVEATGAEFCPWRRAPARQTRDRDDDILRDWECRTPWGQFARIRDRLVAGPSSLFARDLADVLRGEPADLVVADGVLIGVLAGAEAAGLPAVALCPNVYPRPAVGMPPFGLGLQPATGPLGRTRDQLLNAALTAMWRTGSAAFNATRADLGLDPLDDPLQQWDRCARVTVLTARAFDFPAELPANVCYLGPVLDDPVWAGVDVPAPTGKRPRIAVGLSSTHVRGQAALLQRIVVALARLDVEAVVTTGPEVDPTEITAPEDVAVLRSAPHAALFADADLVITHAGHGTLIKALAAGVPVLGIPFGRDQFDNMARVRARGLGARLRPSAGPTKIAEQVTMILSSPEVATRTRAVAAEIQAELRATDVVELITTAG